MLHKEFNNGLRAYPIHQAVQAMGSTARDFKSLISFSQKEHNFHILIMHKILTAVLEILGKI